MKKEIDQRNEDRLLIPCNCGSYHFVIFNSFEWDDCKEFTVALIDQPEDLWWRIKRAFAYIFKGGSLYWIDVSITDKDLNNLKVLIDKHLKK